MTSEGKWLHFSCIILNSQKPFFHVTASLDLLQWSIHWTFLSNKYHTGTQAGSIDPKDITPETTEWYQEHPREKFLDSLPPPIPSPYLRCVQQQKIMLTVLHLVTGYLVYSMNQCTIVQTTSCSITLSTGAPAPSYEASESSGSGTSIDSTGAHTDYPLPTEGDGDVPTESAGYSQSTDVVPSGDEPTETGIETATSTASEGDGSTSSLETGTATDTGASSTSATDISETDAPSAATTAYGTLSAMVCFLAAMLLI
jgi:hypothetical protein